MGVKTLFLITVTTAKMIFPGMPDMPKIPGVSMPNLNAPTRTLRMDLTSDKKANAQSKAQVAIPEGLKLGPKVNLIIDLPTERKETADIVYEDGKPGKAEEFTMKMYWDCSQSVLKGQPKVVKSTEMTKSLSPEQMKQAQKQIQKAVDEAANGSHAYWPGAKAPQIDKAAVTPGDYNLTTNYCGGTSIAFSKGQDFLAPIDLTAPNGEVDTAKTIKIEWKAIPNATAYLLTAFAANDKVMVSWTSSSDPNTPADLYNGAISSTNLQKYIEKGILLPPTKTSCYIPAGIFKEIGTPTLMVTAFGADKIQTKDNIETQVVVRSTATMMLGTGMDGIDEMDEDSDSTDADSDEVSDDASSNDASTETASDSNKTSDESSKSVKDVLKKTFGKFGRKK